MQRSVIDLNEIRRGLYMVLYAGAARADADADPECLARLRATALMPGGDHYRATGDPSMLMTEIQTAMGPGWEPSGEWAEKLQEVLEG